MISSAYEVERRNSGKKQRPAQDSIAGRILVLLETGETIQSSALDVTPHLIQPVNLIVSVKLSLRIIFTLLFHAANRQNIVA